MGPQLLSILNWQLRSRALFNSWSHVCSLFRWCIISIQTCTKVKVQRSVFQSRIHLESSYWYMVIYRLRPFQQCIGLALQQSFKFLISGASHSRSSFKEHFEGSIYKNKHFMYFFFSENSDQMSHSHTNSVHFCWGHPLYMLIYLR